MGGHENAPPISGGVRVFSIGGRMVHQRERLMGMTNEERRWRAQFLKDQVLEGNEPRWSPELYKATHNIFVRMFSFPMDLFEKAVTPVLGKKRAKGFRYHTGRIFAGYAAVCLITYYFKYNTQDWTRNGGWNEVSGKKMQLPGDPNFPSVPKFEKYEYGDGGFSKSIFW